MIQLATDSDNTAIAPAQTAPAIAPTGAPAFYLPVTGGPYQPAVTIRPSRPVLNVPPAPPRPGERANVAPNLAATPARAIVGPSRVTVPWWVWALVAVLALLTARKGDQ